MSLVQVETLSLAYGAKVLFDEVDVTIGPHDRIGLVGPNGTGKSSLMKILAGVGSPDSGKVQVRRQSRVGYLRQELTAPVDKSAIDEVLASVPERDSLLHSVEETQRALESSTEASAQLELSEKLVELQESLLRFEQKYGRHRAERILRGLGFTTPMLSQPVATLSGGWRMRVALAGLLLQEPDLLLLDEPTNHLDLPTMRWFDNFLKQYPKALILISHDRGFLNRQINRVLSLEVEGLRSYSGNYEDYRRLRSEEISQLEAAAERQEARRAEIQSFIDRFKAKASKARQAQSRMKMLEREEVIQIHRDRQKVHFQFPEAPRPGRDVALFKEVSKHYGPNLIYRALSATVERGQRVAVVGRNGAGKTTLLKMLASEIAPDGGTVSLGQNVVLGYYAQHHADTLDRSASIYEETSRLAPRMSQAELRGILGAFLFSGDDVDKKIGVLSGGERARVALARLLLQPSNLLVMDEPTNHLDLDSTEVLIDALKRYTGTLIFVSHNQSFLRALASTIWEVKDQNVVPFPGGFDDYLYHLDQADENAQAQQSSETASVGSVSRLSDRDRRRVEAEERNRKAAVEGPVKKEIAQLEKRIESLEAEKKSLETQLASPELYDDFAKAKPLMDAHRAAIAELEQLYARWEERQEHLARLASAG